MNAYKTYMTEQNLNPKTINNHIRNLTNYTGKLLDTEKEIIKHVKENYTVGSQQKTIITSISKFRDYKGLPVESIRAFLQTSHTQSIELQQEKTNAIILPSIKSLKKKMNDYLKEGAFRNYVVMYLLLNFQTRNQDLVARVIDNIDEVDDDNNWLLIRDNDIVYYRNDYKTADKYGRKKNIIRSKPFHRAVSNLTDVLKPSTHIHRTVKDIAGYTESTLMKANVVENNNIKGLSKISQNRGTALSTIDKSYNAT
mgnify:CR=1 FL=1